MEMTRSIRFPRASMIIPTHPTITGRMERMPRLLMDMSNGSSGPSTSKLTKHLRMKTERPRRSGLVREILKYMKLSSRVLTVIAGACVVIGGSSTRAEEQHELMTALSQTTISGYVDTSAIWSPAATSEPILFQDNFETDTSANWDVLNGSESGTPDFTVNWAFDYGTTTYTSNGVAFNIPAAPNSTGNT